MKVIGITGSIGMGKSLVSQMMAERGVPVHDADVAVHRLLAAGGAGVVPVAALFPDVVVQDENGGDYIDRRALGGVVFGRPDLKKKLEDILHPLVRQDRSGFYTYHKNAGTKAVAYDIPLLFETGRDAEIDAVICVTAPADVQRARVMARPHMTAEKFSAIVASQMPDAEKRRRADYIIDNGGTIEATARQVDDILARITKDETDGG